MALAEQQPMETVIEQEVILNVTPSAVGIIRNLLQERNIPNHALRVFVSGGGCSGMQYGMSFEEEPQSYDAVVAVDDVRLIVDPTSLVYLKGATIDFVDSLIGGGFRIDNPNAVSQCGCGSSFKAENGQEAAQGGGCGTCSSSY